MVPRELDTTVLKNILKLWLTSHLALQSLSREQKCLPFCLPRGRGMVGSNVLVNILKPVNIVNLGDTLRFKVGTVIRTRLLGRGSFYCLSCSHSYLCSGIVTCCASKWLCLS